MLYLTRLHLSTTIVITSLLINYTLSQKCSSDDECARHWPSATCARSRCRCPADSVRKKSATREWICLSVVDAATGESGPPLTCPLPDGAGFQVVLRKDSSPVLCSSKANDCPEGYECIQGLSVFGKEDGVCCPDQVHSCSQPLFDHPLDGHLDRWAFNGIACIPFKWNPERPSSANNFRTKENCEDYCINTIN